MSKTIEVEYRDGTSEEHSFPDKLYDLGWNNYQKIERVVKMNADINRDGEVEKLSIDKEDAGEFLVELQEKMADAVLSEQNIDLDQVKVSTVKTIIREYGNDMQEMGVKLKKKKAD